MTTSPTDLQLPGSLFLNNKKLNTIAGCFSSMASNIRYTLSSKSFINCALVDVSDCFNDGGYRNKIGGIPYGLFYQEVSQKSNFTDGWNHSDAVSLGLSETKVYNEGSALPTAKTYSETLKKRNRTIQYMSNVLRYFNSADATCYNRVDTARTSLEDAGDLIAYNEAYDPREFIINEKWDGRQTIDNPAYTEGSDLPETIDNPNYNPYYVIKNPNYDPYHYVWNVWYHDGTNGLGTLIEGTTLWSKVQDGSITDIAKTLPDDFYDPDHGKQSQSYAGNRSDSMNYICPPDLFRYCADLTSTTVSYALANSSNYTSASSGVNRLNQGIYGRIPKRLFGPLTKIQNITNVFYEATCVSPYTWPDSNGYGYMIHPDTFAANTNLRSVQGLFKGFYVPQDVVFPTTMFNKNASLTTISQLFYCSIFYGTTDSKSQVSAGSFNNNKLLTDISYLFGSANLHVSANSGITVIDAALFTSANHKNINNLTGFLQYQSNTTGTVPAFWEWLTPTAANRANMFVNVRKSNITNSSAIVNAGWGNGMI